MFLDHLSNGTNNDKPATAFRLILRLENAATSNGQSFCGRIGQSFGIDSPFLFKSQHSAQTFKL